MVGFVHSLISLFDAAFLATYLSFDFCGLLEGVKGVLGYID
jgi:hypothetical protein